MHQVLQWSRNAVRDVEWPHGGQLPEQCETCKKQIATLETCVLPDGIEKRGAEVTFRESAEGGISCKGCADGEQAG